MAINKKLIHFNKKSDFESEVAKGNILNYSICFIADTKEIYTHGNYYSQVSEAPTDGQKYIRVNGAWYVLSDSSSSTSGLMSAIDKTKLDRIESGAQKNTVTGVKGNSESSYRTGNINITKTNIGLGNVDNTSDVNKPVSTAQQAALDKKVNKVTGKSLILDSEIEKLAGLPNNTELTNSIANAKAAGDNAQSNLNAHKLNVSNPHQVTKAQLGLGNVNNTSDLSKPISTATQKALDGKVDKIAGKGLSTEDFTGAYKTVLDNLPTNYAPLVDGLVPAANLPSYVDDVIEAESKNKFPTTGESGKIYVALNTNLTYRWGGTNYVEISKSLALGETASTAYAGDKGAANATAIATHTGNTNNPHGVTKSQVGLGNVDNTSDLNKPISTATQSALDGKVDKVSGKGLSSKDYTKAEKDKLAGIEAGAQVNTVMGVKGNSETNYRTGNINITPTNIGLGNVNNTSDLNKPVSTAQQTALDKKVDKVTGYGLSKNDFTDTLKNKLDGIAEGAQVNSITGVKGSSEKTYRTGNVSISASNIGLGNVNNTSDADKPISIATQTALNGKVSTTVKVNGHALSADVTVSKSDVGLSNVDNTSDANKPVSTAQQTALDKKVNKTTTVNGHALSGNVTVTKADVGLGNVDNTSDVNKPISTATQTALDKKVDKVSGKGLSTNDYTTDEKNKLAGIAAGAQVNVIESVKVNGTAQAISNKGVNIPVPTKLSQLTNNIYTIATSAEITAILN